VKATYRMTWPILDSRITLADLIGAATIDLAAAVRAERYSQAGPVQWQLVQDPRGLRLRAQVAIANGDDVVRRPGRVLQPCGTHAAYMRHKARREDPCAECVIAERAYQRARDRRGRPHWTPPAAAAG
jgi:hypothetical protein